MEFVKITFDYYFKTYSNLKTKIMTNNDGNILLALLTGAAIGAGIGILYAPDKGIETRHKIKQKVGETTHDLSERISHAKEELTKTANEKKDAFDRKLDEAISTMSYKADDIIATLERKLEDLKKKNAQFQK
jgi:gas vesicle protein|tara:strand:+ start:730 stop:1125 length:396 start_codon:yes stop_codon:yes gene_type:complete